jgi:FkbM family methyltransferase
MNIFRKCTRFLREAKEVLRVPGSWPGAHELFKCWLSLQFASNKDRPCFRLGDFNVAARDLQEFDYLLREIFIHQEYLVPLDSTTPLIIDCGANIGFATLFFKMRYPDARIICFEPDPSCNQILRSNVEKNGLKSVQVVEAACGKSTSKIPFFLDNNSSLINSVNSGRSRDSTTIEVALVKLSDYITERVDLLKLDVEGSEWDVMQDLVKSQKLSEVDRIVIEYHHRIGGAKSQLSQFLGLLEQAGFSYDIRVGIQQDTLFSGKTQDVMLYCSRLQ